MTDGRVYVDVNGAVIREHLTEEDEPLAKKLEELAAFEEIMVCDHAVPRGEGPSGGEGRVYVYDLRFTDSASVLHQMFEYREIVPVKKPSFRSAAAGAPEFHLPLRFRSGGGHGVPKLRLRNLSRIFDPHNVPSKINVISKADAPETSAMVSDAKPPRSLIELSLERAKIPAHSLKNGKKFQRRDALYGGCAVYADTIYTHHYVRCVGNSEEILIFLCRGVYKVWRAGYHSVCRLVRTKSTQLKIPGRYSSFPFPHLSPLSCAPGSSSSLLYTEHYILERLRPEFGPRFVVSQEPYVAVQAHHSLENLIVY